MAKLSHRDQHVGNILRARVQLDHAIILGQKRKSKVLFQSYAHTNSGTDAGIAEMSFISTAHVSTLLCKSRASFTSHGKLFPNYQNLWEPSLQFLRRDWETWWWNTWTKVSVWWDDSTTLAVLLSPFQLRRWHSKWKGLCTQKELNSLTSCRYD